MTVAEAIKRIDALVRNTFSQEQKLFWLSHLDAQVASFILRTEPPAPYTQKDYDTVLLAKPPFDMMYIYWLEAQMAYANGEIERYNNAISMHRTAYEEYAAKQLRENAPKKVTTMKFF